MIRGLDGTSRSRYCQTARRLIEPDASGSSEKRGAASALGHPHICTVHDSDHQGDIAYLVTEWLDGSTVQERLRSGAMPLHESLTRATEIADALRAVHRAGIVHRDLKPANVMLTTHGAKLLDFGIAPRFGLRAAGGRLNRDSGVDPALGLVTGTPGYMSPEQRRGDAVDARTDLYVLGALLYEMLTGTRALPSGQVLDAANGDAVAGRLEALSLPQSLKRVIEKCLGGGSGRLMANGARPSGRPAVDRRRWRSERHAPAWRGPIGRRTTSMDEEARRSHRAESRRGRRDGHSRVALTPNLLARPSSTSSHHQRRTRVQSSRSPSRPTAKRWRSSPSPTA